jgi:hypothetical protein
VSWLALWLLVVFSWGLKEIDEAQAPTNAQFDSDDTLAATDWIIGRFTTPTGTQSKPWPVVAGC